MTQDSAIATHQLDEDMLAQPLEEEEFDEVDAILDDLRTRNDETPQWEFCEGFMAALVCCRRAIPVAEYLDVLLGVSEAPDSEGSFADDAQRQRFLQIWTRRWATVEKSLDTEVKSLDEEGAYQPEVMDVRGALASLTPEQRAGVPDAEIPAFAQVWALGFMCAVENWPEEWAAPRDKDAAKWLDAALEFIVALTEDDAGPLEISPFAEDGPPSMSAQRLDAYAQGIWAVYDLREIWRSMGPRVETVRKEAEPGRNDPCPCGSGKKYKKCHGA
ncbi:UPF0149 family protein [Rhodoferax aquaticus]|uniref:YecA family protein n=1 Tax=Rhodoferax aquaticus TaxID=2527691 RepID=A0A515EK35_9BURK|nr:UPF0149 family protein [Rhodoferax aquaticus]QDL53034.1 YecA family protein [Rhodoferax aquaticus]